MPGPAPPVSVPVPVPVPVPLPVPVSVPAPPVSVPVPVPDVSVPDVSLEESQLDWIDVLLGLREKQCRTAGGPYLVPLSSPVLVCYYRADLLEKAGLKAPDSWQEYQNLLDRLPATEHQSFFECVVERLSASLLLLQAEGRA